MGDVQVRRVIMRRMLCCGGIGRRFILIVSRLGLGILGFRLGMGIRKVGRGGCKAGCGCEDGILRSKTGRLSMARMEKGRSMMRPMGRLRDPPLWRSRKRCCRARMPWILPYRASLIEVLCSLNHDNREILGFHAVVM